MPSRVLAGHRDSVYGDALPIGSGGGYPGLGQNVNSVGTAWLKHRFPCPAHSVRLAYYNGSTFAMPMHAGVYVEALSATIQCTFDGVIAKTIAPKSFAVTDPVDLTIAATGIRSLTYANPSGTDTWAANAGPTVTGEGSNYAAAGADLTASGPISATPAGYAWGPAAVLATPAAGYNPPVIGLIGDSIVARKDNFLSIPLNGYPEDTGYTKAGVVNVSVGGEAGGDVLLVGYRPRFMMLASCTHIINEYGVNSIGGLSFSLAQMQAENIAIWQAFERMGKKVAQTSVLPGLNAAAAPAKEAVRVAWNNWLRAGAPMIDGAAVAAGTTGADLCPVYDADANLIAEAVGTHPMRGLGYFETADVIETSRNSGVAIADALDDTGHPVGDAHTLMSAAIPFAALGVVL